MVPEYKPDYSELKSKLKKYVWFRHELYYDLVTGWILGTHDADRKDLPVLCINGPTCSGKTVLLRFIKQTVKDGILLYSYGQKDNLSVDGPTLCLDDPGIFSNRFKWELPRPCCIVVKGKQQHIPRNAIMIRMESVPEDVKGSLLDAWEMEDN